MNKNLPAAPLRPESNNNTVTGRPNDIILDDVHGVLAVPDLYPVDPTPMRPKHFAGVNGTVVLGVFLASGIAMAGTVGGAWAEKTHAFNPTSSLTIGDEPELAMRTHASREGADSWSAVGFTHASVRNPHNARTRRPSVANTVAPPAVNSVNATPSIAAPTAGASGTTCNEQCANDVACIMRCPYRGNDATNALVISHPSREQVLTAVRRVRGAVLLCAAGLGRTPSSVNVTVAFGNNGEAVDAIAGGPFAGTAPGACIERAVREMRVPPFSDPTFQISYPFPL